jgi:pimeloyl-ACP methyl ester carboxylesterase
VTVPTGVTVFPGEIFRPPRAWAEPMYPAIRSWTKAPKGGHFAAMEQPALFVEDLRVFVSTIA